MSKTVDKVTFWRKWTWWIDVPLSALAAVVLAPLMVLYLAILGVSGFIGFCVYLWENEKVKEWLR